jgi:3-oxoacyl-[acyl-carrier protein] reductase
MMANIAVQAVLAVLRDSAIPAKAVAEAVRHFDRLDQLDNNAGVTRRSDFFALTEEDWRDGFALDFHTYVRRT